MSVHAALRRAPMIGDIPGLRLLRVGDEWDLIRTSSEVGLLDLAHLRAVGASIGPVLYDGPNERLYYAIQTGTADRWDDLPVRHLSSNSWLVAPGIRTEVLFSALDNAPYQLATDPVSGHHYQRAYAQAVHSQALTDLVDALYQPLFTTLSRRLGATKR